MAALSLTLGVDKNAAMRSIDSIASLVESSPDLPQRLADRGFASLVCGEDMSGLFRGEAVADPEMADAELLVIRIVPEQRFLQLAAAIVAEGDALISEEVDGWPILSPASSCAEAPGAKA